MAKGFRKYDMEFILNTLKILTQNGYNFDETTVATGVHRDTINRWMKKYGEAYHSQIQEGKIFTAALDVSPQMKEYRRSVVTNIESVKDLIINRMAKVATRTKNLDQLSRAFKTLYECTIDIKEGNTDKEKNYLQVITMQINAMNGKLEQPNDIDYEPTDD